MKHLFIINPIADKVKSRERLIAGDIDKFFKSNPDLKYDIHITRWSRDAVGFIRRYVERSGELVRVYAVGGTGTLFEAVNGVIGLANAQVALYPYGICNSFLRYFGNDKLHLFSSLRSLVFSGTTQIDAIRCGPNYGVCTCAVGLEAVAIRDGKALREKISLPTDLLYTGSAFYQVIKSKNLDSHYRIRLDDRQLDGEYVSMLIANEPRCGAPLLHPSVDARPDDGILNLYLLRNVPKSKVGRVMNAYIHGNYQKYPDVLEHFIGRSVSISSDNVMCIALDGEVFYESAAECEIIPSAIDFVCPDGIDMGGLPRIYNRLEVGGK